MQKVFAVILNWNREQDTIDCLKSLNTISKTEFKLKTLIVDNGSSQKSIAKIKNYTKGKDNIDIVINTKNLGYAGGNNVGIKSSLKEKADYVLLMNNDVRVDKYFLKHLLKPFKNKKVGITCPKIYFEKGFEFHKKRYIKSNLGKVFWAAGGVIDWDNVYALNRGVDKVDKGQYDKEEVVDFVSGACMLIKTEVFKKIGFLDKKYYLYLEDADFCMRAKKKGYTTYYVPKSKIWHKVSQSSAIGSHLNDYFTTRNRMYFGMKYAPFRAKVALLKESFRLLISGRKWQKVGIKDFYLGIYGRGSWR